MRHHIERFAIFVALLLSCVLAHAHSIYEEMTRGTECTCKGDECEPVEAIPISASEAKRRKLKSWNQGVDVEPDGPGYWLPKTHEYFPADATRPSPDGQFHRCTYLTNQRWVPRGFKDGVEMHGPEGWLVVPDNSTRDGKPRTRCLFAPQLTH